MALKVDYVDGTCKTSGEIHDLVKNSLVPMVFTNMINSWPAAKWSLKEFTDLFGDIVTTFKLYNRTPSSNKKCKLACNDSSATVAMETDCVFTTASFKEFFKWITHVDHDKSSLGELQKYPCKDFWCYADYKHMAELFSNHSSALSAIDWSGFGFPDKNGYHSTIWVSSDDAYTPCHQDTYGTNLVAQLHGIKRWILFPPSETVHMKPTRIPYEESSIFSRVDVKSLRLPNTYEVNLKPGEVLFVPKHWWHYVESVTPSISINMWLDHKTDPRDRVKESLVNLLVYAVKKTENEPISLWLNPTQELPSSFDSCLELVYKALDDDEVKPLHCKNDLQSVFNCNFLLDCLTDTEVLDKIIDAMNRNMKLF